MDAALDAESLIGPRVSLRPFSLEDVPAVLAYASDPEVTRHLEWDAYDDPKTAMAFIRSTHAGTAWIARAIVLRTDERVIGGADLRVVSTRDRRAELGYGLARSHWGQGYATEAVSAVREWAYAERNIERLISVIAPGNVRSERLAQRLGCTPGETVELFDNGAHVVWEHPR